MILYHCTTEAAAAAILANGFRNNGPFTVLGLYGVFFSNYPVNIMEGAKGDTYLTVNIPAKLIKDCELIEEGKPYREWCIPAALVNQYKITFLGKLLE